MNSPQKTFIGFVGARKGSKGLPGKNKLLLDGEPLFLIALNKLRKAGLKEIIFSSDCRDMLEIANGHGYDCVERPAEFANDVARIPEEIIRITNLRKIEKDFVVSVPPTSPLLRVESIMAAIKKINITSQYDSCIAVTDWHGSFPGLAFYKDKNDQLLNVGNELGIETYPRQNRLKFKQNSGSFYIRNLTKMKTGKVQMADNWLGTKILYQEITETEAYNIDTHDDWNKVQEGLK